MMNRNKTPNWKRHLEALAPEGEENPDYRKALFERAKQEGFPTVQVLDTRLEGETSWHAFCHHPKIGEDRLAAAAAALAHAGDFAEGLQSWAA